jgi:hypothetical protein
VTHEIVAEMDNPLGDTPGSHDFTGQYEEGYCQVDEIIDTGEHFQWDYLKIASKDAKSEDTCDTHGKEHRQTNQHGDDEKQQYDKSHV